MIGKVVDIAIYDVGSGQAEIKNFTKDTITVQWISFCTCYSCCSVDKQFFMQDCTFNLNEDVYSIESQQTLSKDEITRLRNKSITELEQ